MQNDSTATAHAPPKKETPPGILLAADVARIFSEEAGRPIQTRTVLTYIKESRPTVGKKRGRYADNPMPTPKKMGRTPYWLVEHESELRTWWNSRPGQAHGTGGRRAGQRSSK